MEIRAVILLSVLRNLSKENYELMTFISQFRVQLKNHQVLFSLSWNKEPIPFFKSNIADSLTLVAEKEFSGRVNKGDIRVCYVCVLGEVSLITSKNGKYLRGVFKTGGHCQVTIQTIYLCLKLKYAAHQYCCFLRIEEVQFIAEKDRLRAWIYRFIVKGT